MKNENDYPQKLLMGWITILYVFYNSEGIEFE